MISLQGEGHGSARLDRPTVAPTFTTHPEPSLLFIPFLPPRTRTRQLPARSAPLRLYEYPPRHRPFEARVQAREFRPLLAPRASMREYDAEKSPANRLAKNNCGSPTALRYRLPVLHCAGVRSLAIWK